jgi:hypothetical protein
MAENMQSAIPVARFVHNPLFGLEPRVRRLVLAAPYPVVDHDARIVGEPVA